MSSWVFVIVLILAELAFVAALVRLAFERWFDGIFILVLSAALMRPAVRFLTGDVSAFLPGFVWSDGSDGKDQIIFASAASTLAVAVAAASLSLIIFRHLFALLKRKRTTSS